MKVHTILNNDTLLPEVMVMTDGKVSDIALARSLQLPTNQCILIMDRGYSDDEF
ncbi:MAG TPA: transposase, partial [Candidatus Aphodousia faecipullorum]|nr:transposase [Candidatus Aphodousia faecipullorum]